MKEKNILVTGVSRGVGLRVARKILERGWKVYGVSRSKSDEIDKLLGQYSDNFFWMAYDLENVKDVRERVFKEFIGFKTPLHGFVNNAAIAYDDIVTNLNLEPLERMYRINVFTPMMITKYAIRHMLLHNTTGQRGTYIIYQCTYRL